MSGRRRLHPSEESQGVDRRHDRSEKCSRDAQREGERRAQAGAHRAEEAAGRGTARGAPRVPLMSAPQRKTANSSSADPASSRLICGDSVESESIAPTLNAPALVPAW